MGSVVGCVWGCENYDNYSKQRAKEMPGSQNEQASVRFPSHECVCECVSV